MLRGRGWRGDGGFRKHSRTQMESKSRCWIVKMHVDTDSRSKSVKVGDGVGGRRSKAALNFFVLGLAKKISIRSQAKSIIQNC